MTVEQKIRDKWERLKEWGDMKAIAKANDYDRETVSRAYSAAIRGEEITTSMYKAIATFYNKRSKQIKALA